MATSTITFSLIDHAGEVSRIRFNEAQAGVGTIAALLGEANPATAGSLAEAVMGITTCNLVKSEVGAGGTTGNNTPPADTQSHREIGFLVTYTDTVTGKKYHVTIPAPDLVNIPVGLKDVVDMQDPLMQALKVAMDANVLSPAGNATTVDGALMVGRSR